jgi:hypothetical protein
MFARRVEMRVRKEKEKKKRFFIYFFNFFSGSIRITFLWLIFFLSPLVLPFPLKSRWRSCLYNGGAPDLRERHHEESLTIDRFTQSVIAQ